MTEHVRDTIRVQEWMIWARDPWQHYEVGPEGYRITNGRFTFNRVLHGPPGPTEILAGDRPQIKLTQAPSCHYGDLSLAVEEKTVSVWCHEFGEIEATYDAARYRYRLTDPRFPNLTLDVRVLPAADAPGFIVRIQATRPTTLLWAYGALKREENGIQAQRPMHGGIRPADCVGNIIEAEGGALRAGDPSLERKAAISTFPISEIRVCGAAGDATPHDVWADGSGAPPIGLGRLAVNESPVYIAVCITDDADALWTLARLLAFPAASYDKGLKRLETIAAGAVVRTPQPALDQAVRNISFSLDGSWHPPAFLHGAVRWGVECKGWFLGWRGLYGPIVLGWYERVRSALEFHGAHTLDRRSSDYSGPGKLLDYVAFDGVTNRWTEEGNMGEVYMDQLYSYYCWTGDRDLMKKLWPVVKRVLRWEKKTLDPDNDWLYENHVNTWISDGHWYGGGPGVQSSAYLYRAYRLAAEMAEAAGEDATEYCSAASSIRQAMDDRMWLGDRGWYAEYREFLDPGRLHDAVELPSIYHPIDSEVPDPLKAYQMLRFVENRLWLDNDLLLSNDWYPVIVTNGTIAFSEILHTALCYFRLGLVDRGWKLTLRACENFHKARVPGAITEYAGWEGEQGTYADFTDCSSMFARTIVEGLYGIRPRRQDGELTIQPGFPTHWRHAAITLRDVGYDWGYEEGREWINLRTPRRERVLLRLRAREDSVAAVTVNGAELDRRIEPGLGHAWIVVECEPKYEHHVRIAYQGGTHEITFPRLTAAGDALHVTGRGCMVEDFRDPQQLLGEMVIEPSGLRAEMGDRLGEHTFFLKLNHADTSSWQPVDIDIRPPIEIVDTELKVPRVDNADDDRVTYGFGLRNNRGMTQALDLRVRFCDQDDRIRLSIGPHECRRIEIPVEDAASLSPGLTPITVLCNGDRHGELCSATRLWGLFDRSSSLASGAEEFRNRCVPVNIPFNDELRNIFRHEYTDPRPPAWALQIDKNALNAWTGTWYDAQIVNTRHIVETLTSEGIFVTDISVPFRQVREGANGLFVSKWNQFPDRARIPVRDSGASGAETLVAPREVYLLIAGTTFNNQTRIANAEVSIHYADGTSQIQELYNPTTYDSLLQHFSDNYPQWIGGKKEGYYGVGRASGVHADILNIPLAGKEVKEIEVACLAHEIIVGVLGVTFVV